MGRCRHLWYLPLAYRDKWATEVLDTYLEESRKTSIWFSLFPCKDIGTQLGIRMKESKSEICRTKQRLRQGIRRTLITGQVLWWTQISRMLWSPSSLTFCHGLRQVQSPKAPNMDNGRLFTQLFCICQSAESWFALQTAK